MEGQKPSKGRMVRYHEAEGDEGIVAIVVKVWNEEGMCNLSVCNEGGTWSFKSSVGFGTASGQWSWPPRS